MEEDGKDPEKASDDPATTDEAPTDVEGTVGGEGVGRGEEEAEQYDEGDDDEEGEGEEEDEEEEGFALRFDGNIDPLGFAQEENHGVELYQQFERLEYQALAERKRKALNEQERAVESVKKPRLEESLGVTMEEINELMNFGRRRRSRALKKNGRKKGSKRQLPPEIARKLGDATLYYASGDYDVAIPLLQEIVRLAPNLSDAYHILGLIYDAKGDRGKSMNFHMIAAHLSPKDPSIWKKLIVWSIEQKNTGQIRYCLKKAITADPKDVGLRFDLALLYFELGEYQKAAESYEQIVELCPASIEALKMAAKMYKKCGILERGIRVLEGHVNAHHSIRDSSIVKLLLGLYMDNGSHKEALKLIPRAYPIFASEERETLSLKVKEAVCHAVLGNMQHAEDLLKSMQMEHFEKNGDLIIEAADSFFNLEKYHYAQKFYSMCEEIPHPENGYVHLRIAQCFISMGERGKAIPFYYKALSKSENNTDTRIILSSLLLEEGKEQETIDLLSPPKISDHTSNLSSEQMKPWWQNGKVKMQLAKIYQTKGMLGDFVDTIYFYVRETLVIEIMNQKVRPGKNKIAKSVLSERAKLLDEQHGDNLFRGFKPVASMSELIIAAKAKKTLRKLATLKEEKKAAALAAGLDWQSDSDDETLTRAKQEKQEPPLPDFLKDKEHIQFILDLCKALVSVRRHREALEIINHTFKLEYNMISDERREEFRSMGAHIAYICRDPKHGYNYVRYITQQHPYSMAAWNCYYKVVSRFDSHFSRHLKFIRHTLVEHKDCAMPLIIYGHQFTMISQHQSAAAEYLRAYKLQPENPLINLCVGTALINLALGFRLQKKHNCIAQGFAFLYNYLRICNGSQEALYNIARAYQHVGLVTLATVYYEKVLAMKQKDYPIPKLPHEDSSDPVYKKPGYCNLHREAAYNLHLIYKRSGATDLARQLLKNYCTF